MPLRTPDFIKSVIEAIRQYQSEELMSDRELSLAAGLSPTMVSKIKSGKTVPKLSTVRKLRDIGVKISRPPIASQMQGDNNVIPKNNNYVMGSNSAVQKEQSN